jgi:hypothetical protein
MKGDFTRTTFDPKKHFSSVRMQQGRVQLDADWNEQVDIAAHRVESQASDALGACGAPMHAAAFGILPNTASLTANEITRLTQAGLLPLVAGDFLLTPGRYYVDGLLCENEDYSSYTHQADLPGLPALSSPGDYLIYLDVWLRHLTALEDQLIREVALGGPDTATRTRTVWQVRSLPVAANTNCLSDLTAWDTLVAGSSGRLNARAEPEAASTDPCIVPPSAGFRGLQNQLYRVEIHQGGALGAATFKWSRDNGSVLCAVEEFVNGQPSDRLRLRSLGRDQDLGLRIGDWVEVLDNHHELTNTPGDLLQITDIDQDDLIITLSAAVSGYDLEGAVKVRRWDSDGLLAVEVPLTNAGWIPLEEGVEVRFSTGAYHTGDYWQIPARTILGNPVLTHTGGIEWPFDPTTQEPLPQPPAGIRHHYCRLAVVHFDGTTLSLTQDCRPIFPPTTELVHLYYVGGDGQEAMPGELLPQPLQAGVSNGTWPVAGAKVRFTVTGGAGTLTAGATSGSQVTVLTDANGLAACTWQLDNALVSQQVEAFLLDAAEAEIGLPVRYSANLSLASQVAYDGECKDLAEAETVQQALDALCQNAALYYVGGDGQEAPPGGTLPGPLEVRLANGLWPVAGEKIVFRVLPPGFGVLTGGGSSGAQVTVVTDANGLATCTWQLDNQNPSQRVVAFWSAAENHFIHFNANLQLGGGQPEEPAIHIKEILLGSGLLLLHDSTIPASSLKEGILISCDDALSPEAFADKPVCFVTIDMPFPINPMDREIWGSELLGFQPLRLRADVELLSGNSIISWRIGEEVTDFLFRLLALMTQLKLGRFLLAHLTVKGNFVWSERDFEQYLDGEAFGIPEKLRPEFPNNLRLPSGDRVRGGDFEMWFRIVEG